MKRNGKRSSSKEMCVFTSNVTNVYFGKTFIFITLINIYESKIIIKIDSLEEARKNEC